MTSTVSDCLWWCQWLPWFNGKWNWWPSQWQRLPVVESASQWQEEPKKSFRGILGFIFWIMNEWNQAGKSSASQHLPSANADRGAPVTSACLQASTARHWPSLIALGQEKSWIKLGQWHNQFNEIYVRLTSPSFPFVEPLPPKRYMCCISAGFTWRLRQKSAICKSTCSKALLTLLQERKRFSILRTESKGLRLPKHSSIKNVISWEKIAWQTHETVKQKCNIWMSYRGMSGRVIECLNEKHQGPGVKKECKSLQRRLRHVKLRNFQSWIGEPRVPEGQCRGQEMFCHCLATFDL